MRWLCVAMLPLAIGCVSGEASEDGERGTGGDAAVVADTSRAEDAAPETSAPVDTMAPADLAPDVVDANPHMCPVAATPRDCSVGTGTGMADQCRDAPSCFLRTVQKAINGIVSAHPDWFDFVGPGGCPVIKNVDVFHDTVVSTVTADGLCIKRDPNAPGEEITVKWNNDFSENFDIVSSANCARSGDPIYTGYCAPAWW